MYKDFKNSPFYRKSEGPLNYYGNSNDTDGAYKGNRIEIDPEIRYGFKLETANDSSENSEYSFQSAEDKIYEYKPKESYIKPKKTITLKEYDDEHFFNHEEECDVCDYIEILQNMDTEHFKEMFIFSEVIGKPKALKRK